VEESGGVGWRRDKLTRVDLCVLWVRFGAGEVGCEDGVVCCVEGRLGNKARCVRVQEMFDCSSFDVLIIYNVRMKEQRFDCRFQASA
jgi:hypothetical protein